MPLYNFRCAAGHTSKKILTTQQYKTTGGWIPCAQTGCSGVAVREMSGATSQATETFDSPTMARPMVRLADAERIFAERATEHKLQYGSDGDQTE